MTAINDLVSKSVTAELFGVVVSFSVLVHVFIVVVVVVLVDVVAGALV